MLSEAAATGKPLHIFDLGTGSQAMRRSQIKSADPADNKNDISLRALGYKILMNWGPRRLSRDIRLVHDWLTEGGYAVWLAPPYQPSSRQAPDEMPRSVQRVKALFDAT